MAIKVTIQNLINSLIRSNPSLIDKTEHADVEDALLLNSYGNIINETRTTTSHTSRITNPNLLKTNITYNIFIVKQGRLVTIKGIIKNQTGGIVSNSDINDFIFEIVNYEYLPHELSTTTFFPVAQGTFVQFNGTDKKFFCNQLGSGASVTFNIQYFTQN